jgi:hypothetical protein
MQGSKYAPNSFHEYSSKDLNANFRGNKFVATKNTTTNNDMQITDDCLIDGAVLIVLGGVIGDKITAQVIDKDNIFGYGANTVLGQYVTDWYINPQESFQLDFNSTYPAKLFTGLYLRIVYTSIGTENDVDVIINYKLHKVLW